MPLNRRPRFFILQLLAAVVLMGVGFGAWAEPVCKQLGGTVYNCFPAKEVWRTTYYNTNYYSNSISDIAQKAASLAYNNISGFQACDRGLLTQEIHVGPNDRTRLYGVGFWEGYTSLNPRTGEPVNDALVLWGQSIDEDGRTVWNKCRTHPQAAIFKDMICPADSLGMVYNNMPDGRIIRMCVENQQNSGFVYANIPDPATSRDVNPDGEITSCNPVSMCGGNRKIVREIDYSSNSRFPIVWGRTYNHRSGVWRFDYDRSVAAYHNSGSMAVATLIRHDGGYLKFKATAFANGRPTQWAPDMGERKTVLSTFQALYHPNGTHQGFSLVNFQGEKEIYNAQGQLIRLENWHGDGIDLTYNSQGKLTDLHDAQGRHLQVSYRDARTYETQGWNAGDHSGVPTQIGYFANRQDAVQSYPSQITDGTTTTHYTYKLHNGNEDRVYFLETVTNSNGHTKTYTYGERFSWASSEIASSWELTGIIDESGNRYANYTYSGGNVRSVSHGTVGDIVRFESGSAIINPQGRYTQIRTSSPEQSFTDYKYGKSAGLAAPTPFLAGLQASEVIYDDYGNPISIKSFTGSIERRTYDGPRGLMLSRTMGFGTPQAQTTTLTWLPNAPFLATQTESVTVNGTAKTRTTTLSYDAHYRVEEIRVSVNDGSADRVTSFGYDSQGNVVLSVDPAGAETTYTYDGQGNLTSRTTGSNTSHPQVTTFGGYNARGMVGWAQDSNGLKTSFSYDGQQKITAAVQTAAGLLSSRTWGFVYHPTGLLHTTTAPDGTWQEMIYDTAHRLTEIKDFGSDGALLGRTVYTLNTSSELVATQRFNGQGALVLSSTAAFDQYGRANRLKGALNQTTQLESDLDGRIVKQINPLLGTTSYTYDALHRMTTVKDAANGVATLTYGPQNEVATATDQRGVVTTYAYNGFGEITQLASPDRGTWTFGYDDAGRSTTTTDPRGVVVSTAYDALSRPISRTFSDTGVNATAPGFSPGTVTQTFAYDTCSYGLGKLCQIVDSSGLTAYTYNAWGDKAGKAWTGKAGGPAAGATLSTGYGYHPNTGQLTHLTLPSGQTQTMTYGSDGRPAGVAYAGQPVVANVQWTANDQVAGWAWPQATGWSGTHASVSFSYDLDGRPVTIEDLDQRSLVWDAGDRLVGVDDANDASSSQVYGYDAVDRLTSADIGFWNGPLGFTYDAVGNRTALTGGEAGDAWQYTYGLTNNRLTTQTAVTNGEPGQTFTASYDAMGNLVGDGIGLQLRYDATGRLVQGSKGPQSMTAAYNALGQRMVKASGSEVRVYAVDEAGRPLGVYVVDAAQPNGYRVEEEYVHLDGWRPVAVVRPDATTGMANPQIFPILTDHLGTPRKVLDGNTGDTRWSWDAKQPFGHEMPNETPTAGQAAFTFDLRFPGQRYDEETGLFHNGFRDYHSGLGRYVQSDPLGLEAGWNTFVYTGNQPLIRIDPYGLWFGLDDAVFAGGGAILGVGAKLITDASSGSWSSWEDYTGAAVGGAVGGEILLYTANPFLAGAGGSLAGNLTSQGLKIMTGKQCEIDAASAIVDTTVGAATGFIPGKVVPGINRGRGSNVQVFRQMRSKAINGTASSITPKTALKMGRGAFQEHAMVLGAGTGAVGSLVYGEINK